MGLHNEYVRDILWSFKCFLGNTKNWIRFTISIWNKFDYWIVFSICNVENNKHDHEIDLLHRYGVIYRKLFQEFWKIHITICVNNNNSNNGNSLKNDFWFLIFLMWWQLINFYQRMLSASINLMEKMSFRVLRKWEKK